MARFVSGARLCESRIGHCRRFSAGTTDHAVPPIGSLGRGTGVAPAAHMALCPSAIQRTTDRLGTKRGGLHRGEMPRVCIHVDQLGDHVYADSDSGRSGDNRCVVCLCWRVPDQSTNTLSRHIARCRWRAKPAVMPAGGSKPGCFDVTKKSERTVCRGHALPDKRDRRPAASIA